MSEVPPLDDDMQSLLEGTRVIPEAPLEARERLRARLAASVPPPGGGGAGSSGEGGGRHEPASLGHAVRSPTAAAARWKIAALFALGIGASGAGGFLLGRGTSPTTERVVYVPSAPLSSLVPATPSSPAGTASVPTLSIDALPIAAATASAPPPLGASLARERILLDAAKTALGRGEGEQALTALSEHERKFPSGALTEEREALAVQALVLAGRTADAASRAARFRTRFPNSLFLPAVNAALEGTP